MKRYCYKIKWSYLKVRVDNAYAKAKIEKYGFAPIFEEFDEGEPAWNGGWAKKIIIQHDSSIGKWVKKNVEQIYKAEAKFEKETGETSKWLQEIRDSGYEFDEEGNIVENEKSRYEIPGELCVFCDGPFRGTLFINIGALIEIYDSESLLENAREDIEALLKDNVIYKKKYVVK